MASAQQKRNSLKEIWFNEFSEAARYDGSLERYAKQYFVPINGKVLTADDTEELWKMYLKEKRRGIRAQKRGAKK